MNIKQPTPRFDTWLAVAVTAYVVNLLGWSLYFLHRLDEIIAVLLQ